MIMMLDLRVAIALLWEEVFFQIKILNSNSKFQRMMSLEQETKHFFLVLFCSRTSFVLSTYFGSFHINLVIFSPLLNEKQTIISFRKVQTAA